MELPRYTQTATLTMHAHLQSDTANSPCEDDMHRRELRHCCKNLTYHASERYPKRNNYVSALGNNPTSLSLGIGYYVSKPKKVGLGVVKFAWSN